MCLAIPARLLSVEGDEALADCGGARTRISVALIDAPCVGDWVVIHTGYALARMDADAAAGLDASLAPLLADGIMMSPASTSDTDLAVAP